LDAIQYSNGSLSGSLAVTEYAGATFTVAEMGSFIGIRGPLHRDCITLGVGLRQPPGSKQWMRDVDTGTVGVFVPGEEHHGLHPRGSRYVAVSMSRERLEEIAAHLELILDSAVLSSSGAHPRLLPEAQVSGLTRDLGLEGKVARSDASGAACWSVVVSAVRHIARLPRRDLLRGPVHGYARIVARARDYAMEHLDEPISAEEMARAASTSVRSLHRAFVSVLGESPGSFVRRIRLHRLRYALTGPAARRRSVSHAAYASGITHLGRMARWYRETFGELPSETLARGGGDDGGP
jgi:AraC-like DNA-binding protein